MLATLSAAGDIHIILTRFPEFVNSFFHIVSVDGRVASLKMKRRFLLDSGAAASRSLWVSVS
jgi:hypothetical protein